MLTKKQKERIIELLEQGYSQRYIREDTGHALQTISDVIKEYKKKKLDETKQKNKEIVELKEGQVFNGAGSFDSTVDGVRTLVASISNIIKKGNAKVKEREEWELYLEDLQKLLRFEVDEKIVAERADAVNLRDEQWREYLKQNYIEKKVAIGLEDTIISKDVDIDNLKNIISEKDNLIRNKNFEISQIKDSDLMIIEDLKSQIRRFFWDLQGFIEENRNMHNSIQEYQYYYNQREQEYKKRERELSNEKTTFNKERKEQEIISDKSFFEVDRKLKDVEMRENQLNEQAVKLIECEDEFNKMINQIFNTLKEWIRAVEKREKNVEIEENLVLRQKERNDLDSKNINNEMENLLKERQNISKVMEELEKERKNLKREKKQALKKPRFHYVVLKPYRPNSKMTGKINQSAGEQKKPVILHPI